MERGVAASYRTSTESRLWVNPSRFAVSEP